MEHLYIMYGGAALTQQFVNTFKEFPPRQKAASFTIGDALERMPKAGTQ